MCFGSRRRREICVQEVRSVMCCRSWGSCSPPFLSSFSLFLSKFCAACGSSAYASTNARIYVHTTGPIKTTKPRNKTEMWSLARDDANNGIVVKASWSACSSRKAGRSGDPGDVCMWVCARRPGDVCMYACRYVCMYCTYCYKMHVRTYACKYVGM